jgi:plasmid stability protein
MEKYPKLLLVKLSSDTMAALRTRAKEEERSLSGVARRLLKAALSARDEQ